mgnify:FL=1
MRQDMGQVRQEVGEIRGEFRAGTRMLAGNDRELFEQNRDIRDRLTRIEARPASGPPPTARLGSLHALTGLLTALGAVLVPLGQLAALVVVAALALKGALSPEESSAWLKSLSVPAVSAE